MMKKKTGILDIISMVFLLVLSFIFIFPFYWILTGAFKSQKVTVKLPPEWFPLSPTLENFHKLMQNPALQWLWNSVFICAITMLIVCVVSSMAGYVWRRSGSTGRRPCSAFSCSPWPFPSR